MIKINNKKIFSPFALFCLCLGCIAGVVGLLVTLFVPTTKTITENYGSQRKLIIQDYTDDNYKKIHTLSDLFSGPIKNPYKVIINNPKESDLYQVRQVIDNTIYTTYSTLDEIQKDGLNEYIWGKVYYGTVNNDTLCFVNKNYNAHISEDNIEFKGCIDILQSTTYPEIFNSIPIESSINPNYTFIIEPIETFILPN